MRTCEAARGRWIEIFQHYGLPPVDPRKHYPGPCPICTKKGKFRIDDKDGTGSWICVCGAGTGVQLVMEKTGKSFKDIASEIDDILGNKPDLKPKITIADQVRSRFLSLEGLRGTDGEKYLNSRGIYTMPKRGVRWSTGESSAEDGRKIPCLYAVASNKFGAPIFRHLTFIEDGKKADISTPKRMLGLAEYKEDACVKLFEAGEVLGIAEGMESALSVTEVYKMPCWSSLSAALMAKFKAPTGVKKLYVFADNDTNGTGLRAGFTCGNANILSGNDVEEVFIRCPKQVNDMNDFLLDGGDIVQWKLHR